MLRIKSRHGSHGNTHGDRRAQGRGDAVEDHAQHGERHAGQLLGADRVAQEGPAAQQHQDRLAVPQHLRTDFLDQSWKATLCLNWKDAEANWWVGLHTMLKT